jgi:hypothetical protein
MSRSIRTSLVVVLAVCAVTFTACTKKEEAGKAASLLQSDQTILRYVPADTPYVIANVKPLPDDLMDKMEPKIDRLLKSYQTVLKEAIAAKQREKSGEEGESEQQKRIEGVVDELSSLMSIEGIRGAGIGRDATMAIYGNGLLPVLRIAATDGKLFDAAISRLEEKSGQKLQVDAVDGQQYRYVDAENFRFILAVLGNQVVLTALPAGFDEAQLKTALGLTLPAQDIAKAGVLAELATKYGYTNHYAGYIDAEKIVWRVLDPKAAPDVALVGMLPQDPASLSDDCKSEIREVAGIAPRLVIGYTAVGTDRISSLAVLEMRDDIAKGLATLPVPVPGLGGDKGGLLSFGISLDPKALLKFANDRIAAMEADPFKCEYFASLQQGIPQAKQTLNQPLPPIVYDFKGLLAIIDDVEGLDIATKTPPTSVKGRVLMAMDNAPVLVQTGAMFSPDLANMNLQPDGKPVPLDLPQVKAAGMNAFVALTQTALALAIGEDADTAIPAMLKAAPSDPPPFMSFSVDAARYYKFLAEAIAAAEPPEGSDQPAQTPEMKQALNDVMTVVSELYDRIVVEVLLTPRGVEMPSTVTLQD